MANSGNLISKPVREVADIATILGEGTYKISTLCTSGNINRFSKIKPFHITTGSGIAPITEISDAHRKVNNYGLTGIEANYNELLTKGAWGYDKPQGGSADPYRFSDFAGYYHNAVSPIHHCTFDSVLANDGTSTFGGTFSVTINFMHDTSNVKEVQLRDLTLSGHDILTYYPTLILHRLDGSSHRYYAKSGEYSVQDAIDLASASTSKGFGATIPIGDATYFYNAAKGTEVDCIATLASAKIGGATDLSGYSFVNLECTEGMAIVKRTIVRELWWDGLTFKVTANVTLSKYSDNFTFKINSVVCNITASSYYGGIDFYIKPYLHFVGAATASNLDTVVGGATSVSNPKSTTFNRAIDTYTYTYTYPVGYGGAAILELRLCNLEDYSNSLAQTANIQIAYSHDDTAWMTNHQISADTGITATLA